MARITDRRRCLIPRRRIAPAFVVIRLESDAIKEHEVTVKEVVSTEAEARAEVARLNRIRRDDAYRYVWQTTRWVAAGASEEDESLGPT